MEIKIESRQLGDVCVLAPQVFQDDRGFFTEVFRADLFGALGLPTEFVQDNHSGSVRGVLRGLHFQWDPPMGKLMRVTRGTAFLAAVDIRKRSPTLGSSLARRSRRRAASRSGRLPGLRAGSVRSRTSPRFSPNAPVFITTKASPASAGASQRFSCRRR